MKIEYNEASFSHERDGASRIKDICKGQAPLLFGIAALVFALSLLPIGFFVNISLDIFGGVLAENVTHYTVIFLAVSALIAILSAVLAIFSLLLFKSSEKRTQDILGVIFSVISFCVCALALTLIMLGLLVW